jgi:hypothetical protein
MVFLLVTFSSGYVVVVAAVAALLVGSMTTCVGGVNIGHSEVSLNIIGGGEEGSEDS